MKYIFKAIGAVLLTFIFSLLIIVFSAVPPLPERAEEIINNVINSEIPIQIHGDTGYAKSGDLNIWYESIEPVREKKGTIILIMGLGGDGLEWPEYYYRTYVDSGYQVIRFDNRSTGQSTWVKNSSENYPFNLYHMAGDAIAVLDELKVKKAHVMGLSMGGMIAQVIAIEHPERVMSLTSIMSSADINDPELPGVSRSTSLSMVASGARYGFVPSEKNTSKLTISVRNVLAPDLSDLRIKTLAERIVFNMRHRSKYNLNAFIQHTRAIDLTPPRTEGLKTLKIPALIVHGIEDPLIPVEHGKKCAALIPGSESLFIEGMGHDLSTDKVWMIHKAFFDSIHQN